MQINKTGSNNITKLNLKVVPGASHPGISGWLANTLKVRVSAQPERGKANKEVEVLICRALGLPQGSAKVIAGKTSQHKVIEVYGLSLLEIERCLGK